MKKALPAILLAAAGLAAWLVTLGLGSRDSGSVARTPARHSDATSEPGPPELTGRPPATAAAAEIPHPSHWLHVEVRLSGTGEPLEGIRVRGSWSREMMKETPEVDGDQTRTTDAEGRASFGPLPSGSVHLLASAEDCVAGLESLDFDPTDEGSTGDPKLVVTLSGTASFSGHVFNEDETPAAGCSLSVQPRASGRRQFEGCFAKTDEHGAFRFQGLDPDDVFSVRAFGGFEGDDPEGWALARPGESDVTIVLHKEGAARVERLLSVRVVDPDGRPVAEFQASVRGDMAEGAECSKEPGLLRCPAVTGPCWIDLWNARDERERPLPLGPAFVGPLDPAAGEHTVVLPREALYAGRVLDATGNGVAGVKLTAHPWSADDDQPDEDGALSSTVSGEDGSFRLGRLPCGKVRVFFEPPEGYAHRDPVEAVGGTEGAKVILPRSITATLRIVSEDELPLSGVSVSVCVPGRGMGIIVSHAPLPGIVTGDWTAEDGLARLEGLDPSRTYILRVNWGFRFLREDALDHVDESWRPADGTIKLRRAYSVSGRVVSTDGTPVSEAPVRVNYGDGAYWESSTGADGTFEFGRLPEGECRVEAWEPGADTETPARVVLSSPAGSEGVTLRLPANK